jgi:HEAT repeat protein
VVETLGKLEPATLAQHGEALVASLEDLDEGVRKAVVETLGKLQPLDSLAVAGLAI